MKKTILILLASLSFVGCQTVEKLLFDQKGEAVINPQTGNQETYKSKTLHPAAKAVIEGAGAATGPVGLIGSMLATGLAGLGTGIMDGRRRAKKLQLQTVEVMADAAAKTEEATKQMLEDFNKTDEKTIDSNKVLFTARTVAKTIHKGSKFFPVIYNAFQAFKTKKGRI